MDTWALIAFVVGAAIFAGEAGYRRSVVALGLCATVVGLILTFKQWR